MVAAHEGANYEWEQNVSIASGRSAGGSIYRHR